MPESALTEFITKTEAAQVYRRSERSISRDITNALRFSDRRVLQHIELRLEDGTRRPGIELTIEEVVDLRDRGMNPTWLLATSWLKKTYGRRDEPPPLKPVVATTDVADEAPETTDTLPDDLAQRAAVLAAQNEALRQSNEDLRAQAERLEKELDRRALERTEENELQKQSNVLMQQVYNMLSTMQESAGHTNFLPAPRTPLPNIETGKHEAAKTVIKGEGIQQAKTSPVRRKMSRKQSSSKTLRSHPKPRSARAEPQVSQPPKSRLHRWLPTFLGSSSRRKK